MRTVIALGMKDSGIEFFEGVLNGRILEAPRAEYTMEGFPLEAIFFVPEWGGGLVLGQVHRMPSDKKKAYLTHREKAVAAAIPRIRELLKT